MLVSSLHNLQAAGVPFLFTDRHAYLKAAQFHSEISRLDCIDWRLLQTRNFKRDPEDPEKLERYQAEALVYRHVPATALLGLVCFNETAAACVRRTLADRDMDLKVLSRPKWYL
jgi:hypothetical protein